ncbi:MAG TPA: arylamine N-acetyltransferase [Victivallales bacterium]|nr:arylamine N-acetyltransferase [Victivallales bacterium]
MLTKKNIIEYLAKLTERKPELSYLFLKEINNSHVSLFSFNNLSVLLHENLSLESNFLFEKIIKNGRGGYCFEHNKLFYDLLISLGYECKIVLARVLYNQEIDAPRTHRITMVTLDEKKYILDVGFGPFCSREPLLLNSNKIQDQNDAQYKIVHLEQGNYLLQILKDDKWFTLYSFDTSHFTESDCLVGHHYSSTYHEAVFVNNLVVSLKSKNQISSLRNREYHKIKEGQNKITIISSESILRKILIKEFGISLKSEQLSILYEKYCNV